MKQPCGCGTYFGKYANCYLTQQVLTVRSPDPLMQRYLAAFLRSDVAERIILSISKPTKSFDMEMIKIGVVQEKVTLLL